MNFGNCEAAQNLHGTSCVFLRVFLQGAWLVRKITPKVPLRILGRTCSYVTRVHNLPPLSAKSG